MRRSTGRQPLTVTVLTALTAVMGILAVPRSHGQSTQAYPAFEAASIKLNLKCGGPGRGGGMTSPGRITLECAELRDLILTAYGIYAHGSDPGPRAFRMQVLGGPGWIDSDRYDITAKAQDNPPLPQLYGPMLRALLEDRFQLKVHRETKEAPVYFLAVARGGSKLRPARESGCVGADRTCESQVKRSEDTFDMDGATMADFSTQLAMRLDRDVIDRTQLAGKFDIHLEVSAAELAIRAVAGAELRQVDASTPVAPGDAAGPSIFSALEKQLGLKLKAARGPVEYLVIDHIEKPSKN